MRAAAERVIVIRAVMTRIDMVGLTTLFFVAVAPEHQSAGAKDRSAAKSAQTAVVDVRHPTVTVFVPPEWERDSKSDEGTREMIAHVRFAVEDVNRCKGTAEIAVQMVFADRLAVTTDGRHTEIDLSRKFPDSAGAYLFRPGKKPCSIATPRDTAFLRDMLSEAVGELFEVPACLQKGMSNVCARSAG